MEELRLNSNMGYDNKDTLQRAKSSLPELLPQPLLLNLGCGGDIRDGFINIDLFSDDPRVVYMDIRKLDLPDSCVDLILASDIIMQFSHREIDNVLKEWARVMKSNGDLIIRCPSLYLQAKAYLEKVWNADIASYMIFGPQVRANEYYYCAFDKESIKKHLNNSGFEVEEITEHDITQERGFTNLNMTIKAKRRAEVTKRTIQEPNLFSQLYEMDSEKKSDDKKITTQTPTFDGKQFIESGEFLKYGVAPENAKLNLVWEGSQFVYHSLALINREICNQLLDSGLVNLTIVPYEKDQFSPDMDMKYIRLFANDVRVKPKSDENIAKLAYCWVRHQWPPQKEEPKGAKWVIMQPWEFTAHRKDFINIFKNAEELWTPSNYSRNTFLNSGMEFDRVQVIPNGVDPELFKPYGEKYPLHTIKKFKLLFVGGTIFRKGIDLLLRAYTEMFTSDDDICLVIKDMGSNTFYKERNIAEEIKKIQHSSDAPEIIYIDEELTEEQIVSLYRACNLFVCPYRGEGFSLPTLEAMACGLPVVVTRGGATDDFVDEEVGWQIPADILNLGNVLDGMELTGDATLLEPNYDILKNTLKEIYNNPAEVNRIGLIASAKTRKYWTWRNSAIKVLARLDALYSLKLADEADKILPKFEDYATTSGEAEREYMNRNYHNSETLFKSVVAQKGIDEKIKLHCLIRLIELALRKYDVLNAEILFEDIIALENHPIQYYLKAKIQDAKEDYISALEEITKFLDEWNSIRYEITIDLTHDALLVFTADLLSKTDDCDGALRLYSEALKINPENANACYGAGICFKKIGAKDEAKEMLQWAVTLDPNFELAKNELMLL